MGSSGGAQPWILGGLVAGVIYAFFIHDRVDYSLLPWNRATGGKGNWDDQIAREAAATLEMDVTASELFPSPPAARSVSHRDILEPPENITELDDWVKKVKADSALEEYQTSLADKWGTEAKLFIETRTNQERDWLMLEKELNRLYGWFNAFYNGMLESKMHVNTMHEAPPAPPPAPPSPPEAGKDQAIQVTEVDALIREEAEAHVNLTEFGGNGTAALLEAAGQLNARISREQKSIDYIRSSIRSYEKSHKAQENTISDVKAKKLGICEDDAEARRQTFLELHSFMDSIFQHMSQGLEGARVQALRIRVNPTDGRSAEEEISSMLDKLHRRDPTMSHELAQVMPQARTRGAQLQQLDAALAEFKKQAKDIDGLMEVMGKVAEVLIETFKGVFASENSISNADAMLAQNKMTLGVFKESFEVTMKQKDLAYKIVQLAGGLADISMQNMDSKKTVDGLAVQLHNLDSVDEDVKHEAQDFKRVVETERTLAGVVKDVVTFVNGCSKLVKSADLTMTSGKAKVMNYYAHHKLYSADPDGQTKQLNNLDTRNPRAPRPPAAPVKYDYAKAIDKQSSQHNWWQKAPAPPPLPKGYGR